VSEGRLDGRVAIVTGGASGIGCAVAERLVAEGARVVVGDLDEAGLADVAASLGEMAAGCVCDVTDPVGPDALVALAVERFGRLDIAVANAGGGTAAALVGHDVDEWRRIIDLNLTGAFLTVRAAGQAMADGGSIIVMSSLAAVQPARGQVAYCAAKAGVVALANVAALELGERSIRVNAVAPGLVETPATAAVWQVPGLLDGYCDNTAIGDHGRPDDVAAAVAYLASDDARFVSGTTLLVDGGAHHLGYPDTRSIIRRAMAAEGAS
jgi:NAD(P)-dependent dehydrogenase (short-subunit alcohol dehydrogenase family)